MKRSEIETEEIVGEQERGRGVRAYDYNNNTIHETEGYMCSRNGKEKGGGGVEVLCGFRTIFCYLLVVQQFAAIAGCSSRKIAPKGAPHFCIFAYRGYSIYRLYPPTVPSSHHRNAVYCCAQHVESWD